ncbi:MAG: FkbM family methyltransferase [Oscillospiraceae bacterium]|nr:FkbM family methyltransferase [Oscillospiraceae bacterium]
MDWTQLQKTKKPIVLYGMGNGAERIIEQMRLHGAEPAGVFASDEFVRGQTFCGFRVMRYDEAKAAFGDMVVLVAFGTAREDVLARIRAIASEQELYVPDLPVVEGELFTREFVHKHKEALQWVYDRLADDVSKKTLESVIQYKLTWQAEHLFSCEMPQSEAYEHLLCLQSGERFLDLGAYRGDTVEEFVRYCPKYASVTAVEPDGYCYRKLTERTAPLSNCTCIHAAASSRTGEAMFSAKAGRGSHISKKGAPIQTVCVDDLAKNGGFTFLNIDVEGAESDVIEGAVQTLSQYRPKLLLAAYHRSEDLFCLPMQVLNLNPNYRLYLRKHPGLPAWDINYYLIP